MDEPNQPDEIGPWGKRSRVLDITDSALAEIGYPPGRIRWNADRKWWQYHTSIPKDVARRALLVAMASVYGRSKRVPCLQCTSAGEADPCITVGDALIRDDHAEWATS